MIYQYRLFMFCFEGRNYLSGFKYMYSRGCFKEHLSCYYLGWTQGTFLPVLKYPVTFGPFWGTAYPSSKPVWECNVLLKQNTLKSQSLSLEWRFPSLKSFPSSCFLLFSRVCCLDSHCPHFSRGSQLELPRPALPHPRTDCVRSALPRGFQTGAPALTKLVQVTFRGWQLHFALDSWSLPFLLGIFEEGVVLISGIVGPVLLDGQFI